MIRYFLTALIPHLRKGLLLYLLTVCGVALGVASVVAIQIINSNAAGAFEATVEAISGDADLTIQGNLPTFTESVYPVVLQTAGVESALPLYQARVIANGAEDVVLEILGVDLWAPGAAPWEGAGPSESAGGNWIALSPELSRRLGAGRGNEIEVSSGSRRHRLRVEALVDFSSLQPQASSRLAVMDIARCQHLFGRPGHISRIFVQAAPEVESEVLAERLRRRLPGDLRVMGREQQSGEARQLLAAFRINLTALSLISFAVGWFLIYTSVQASLLQRQKEMGVLRCLGASRSQVLGLILAEVFLLGVAGTALGTPAGYWAAQSRIDAVGSMLSNIYLLERIESIHLPGWILPLSFAIGVGGALAGALLPILEVVRRPPRALLFGLPLQHGPRLRSTPLLLIGILIPLAALIWYFGAGAGTYQWSGFVLGLALLAALPFFVPQLVFQSSRRVPLRSFGLSLSFKNLSARLLSSSFAVACLSLAVCMLVGLSLMVGSFRETVRTWIETTVSADIYISAQSWAGKNPSATLDPEVVEKMASHPSVQAVDRLRKFPAYLNDRQVWITGVEIGLQAETDRFPLLSGDREAVLSAVRSGDAVLVSEPLARRAGLQSGGRVDLPVPSGNRPFQISGIFYDYTSESGTVVMDLSTMSRHFGAAELNSLALYLVPGADAEAVAAELEAEFSDFPLSIRSNRSLREGAFRLFDQTFAVVRLLQGMSLLIALCGITLTLLIQARQRTRELAAYRALGATRRQVFTLFLGEGAAMTVLALLLGSAAGFGLAMVLVFAVNPAYFGWTIRIDVPWGRLFSNAVLLLAAAAAAGLFPALRASRSPLKELSRDEF